MLAKSLRRLLLCALLLPCLGFDWPGQVYRLQRELAHADPAQRRDLIRRFAQFSAEEVKEPVLHALEDDDAVARLEAAAVAGRVRLREAVPILLDWLDDKEADTRRAAASALGHIGEPRALPALTRALGDSSAEVRREAVGALGRIGGPDSVVPLLGRLEDVDVGVRVDAIEALAAERDARAVVPLLGQASDPSSEVRVSALRALGQIGDARALPALTRALDDEAEDVHLSAAAALGQLGDKSAVHALKATLARDDARLGQAVIAAISNIDDDDARQLLVEQLSVPPLRHAAISALVHQTERLAPAPKADALVDAVAATLRSPTANVRLAAAEALARMAEVASIRSAVPALIAALPSDDNNAPLVMQALASSGAPEALMPLLERLGQSQGEDLTPVLEALALYFDRGEPDGRAADPLLGRLASVSPAQRVMVVELLGRVGAVRALPALGPLLASTDADLRLATLRAIGALGASEGAPLLMPLLDADSAATRFEAARALRSTADAAIAQALLARLTSDATADRHALLIALGGALGRLERKKQVPARLAHDARAAFTALIGGDDPELGDRALDAVAQWAPEHAIEILGIGLRSPSSRRRAATTAALSQLDESGAREMLRYVLLHGAGREAAAAAAGLSELGDQRDVPALIKSTKRLRWPVPGAAAYALVRMAERGVLKPHATTRALCELGRSREPYVRANVAAALAGFGAGACEDAGPDPLQWITPQHAAVVRAAAARWTRAASEQNHLDSAAARAALERCAASDVEASVRAACSERTPATPRSFEPTDVYAYARDGVTLLRNTLVAIELANGAVYLGNTDRNGHIRLKAAPRGPLQLGDPGLVPLEPAN